MFFFVCFNFSFFFSLFSRSPRGQGQTAAIYCKHGKFHSDPFCTDPVQSFPIDPTSGEPLTATQKRPPRGFCNSFPKSEVEKSLFTERRTAISANFSKPQGRISTDFSAGKVGRVLMGSHTRGLKPPPKFSECNFSGPAFLGPIVTQIAMHQRSLSSGRGWRPGSVPFLDTGPNSIHAHPPPLYPQSEKTYVLNSRRIKSVSVSVSLDRIPKQFWGCQFWRDMRTCTSEKFIRTQLKSVSVSFWGN